MSVGQRAIITLYGTPVSNFYNTVLCALYYKGVVFTQCHLGASQEPEFLAKSPMGKVPYIEHDGETLSETSVILEYLDEQFPQPALYGGNALQRARTRQLIKFLELYVEAPARALFPGVFWFQSNEAAFIEQSKATMERGLNAAELLLADNAGLRQKTIHAADIFTYFTLTIAGLVATSQYQWDILEGRPCLQAVMAKVQRLDCINTIEQQRQTAMTEYMNSKAALASSAG